MRNKILLGAGIFAAGFLLMGAFAKFAESDNKVPANVPVVLQAVASAPPAAAATAAASIAPAAGNTDAPRDFNDWRLVCETPAKGGKKQCEVFQRMMWGKDKGTALTTLVHMVKNKDKKDVTMIRVVTPLGTLLTPGMAIKIDDGKQIKVPYLQCLPGGCLVDMVFDQEMMDKMKKGKTLFVAYRAGNGKDAQLPVSLKGFGPALDAMAQAQAKG
ncbi:MAG: invasion associated locus B family protein [Alphaproteobacteria bacterium]|nr:MAG: invasion associated locus B family protein [Alphaproteobacteria bacterium]